MKKLVFLISLRFFSLPALAQSHQFEVASIKPTKLVNVGVKSACHGIDSKFALRDLAAAVPHGRCIISSGRLSHMIGVAYRIPQDVIDGGPDWVKTGGNRFDFEGKADDPSSATESDLLIMLQNLLADRFKLKFHWEVREIDGFELFVTNDGPKFHEAKPDEEEKISVNAGFVLELLSGNRPDGDNALVPSMPATLSAQKVSMARFAQLIEPAVLVTLRTEQI